MNRINPRMSPSKSEDPDPRVRYNYPRVFWFCPIEGTMHLNHPCECENYFGDATCGHGIERLECPHPHCLYPPMACLAQRYTHDPVMLTEDKPEIIIPGG